MCRSPPALGSSSGLLRSAPPPWLERCFRSGACASDWCGFAAGSALGLGSGGIVGGLAGYNIFCRRASISALAQKVWSPVQSVIDLGVDAFHREAKRATGKIASIKERLVSSLAVARDDSMKVLRDKRVQVVSASAACGAATVGAAGAASGFAAGGLFGALAGVIPAFFTFGLSIPVCAAVGSSCGFVAGSTAGASTGLVAGGAAGLGVYGKRHAIEAVARSTWTKLETFLARARAASLAHATAAKNTANSRYEVVKSKAFEAAGATKTKTLEVISDRGVQVTTGSAACGAAAGSVGGAATGFLTGASLGAAVGVVPAVFTFGLSVPVGAAIGAGCGLTAGATVGGTAGGVAGGVAGRSMYFNRQRLRNGAAQTWSKASDCAEFVKIKASKLVGGTGGTD
eukprot:TRINITY_DN24389_c0_g1_i3.p1 TRINITY_DN24389_c0_g1~~TRINITY_DN24389_c0_g1_i3.p1  ORF type:complete len:400 (-),score=73.90 TRINITY_DN24389_c0_g1_i3:269-1468(-)